MRRYNHKLETDLGTRSSPPKPLSLNVSRYQMKTRITLTILLLVLGCRQNFQTYEILDVTKQEIVTLNKVNSEGNVHGLSIVGKGYLEGTAEIIIFLNEKPYKIESLSGNVNFSLGGDWYSESVKVEYKPLSVQSGVLALEYKFKTL